MIATVSFGQLIERVRRWLSNQWPDIADTTTNNEVALYVYEAIGEVITQQANQQYTATGIYPDQDSFVTNYSFPCTTLSYNFSSQVHTLTLPFPPINLPLGYSIKAPYFSGIGAPGKSAPLLPVHGYQKGYSSELPMPDDVAATYEVEGNQMNIYVTSGIMLTLTGWTLNIPMLSARSKTGSDDDLINLPDGEMSMVFDIVTGKLANKLNRPRTQANTGAPRFTETA
jgi:hypothetical protein